MPSKSPRLLMIAERFPPDLGGVARSADRTAKALGELGVEVHVLAWTRTRPAGVLNSTESASPRGPVVHRMGLYSNLDLSLQHSMNVVEWLHGEWKFGAIWGHYLHPSGFLAVLAARGFGVASVVAARGNDVDRLMFPPGDFARLIWTLQHADIVSAVSRDLAAKIRLLLDRPAGVEVISNVVDPEIFAPGEPDPLLRVDLGIVPGEMVLGFCGELRHKKGLPFLLQALREVRQVRPACLLVIGEVRPREATTLSTFAATSPEDAKRILVTGPIESQEEIARHLRLCDVVLCPSVWDGLPNSLLEAMSCARPVIASDAGGIPEAIEHGQSGLLIPKSSLDRLGEAILEFLDQGPATARTIGEAARSRTLATFHPGIEREALRRVVGRLFPDAPLEA